jgi:hypothetical protein
MPKKALFYCLKVWITGVVVGPLLFYAMDKHFVDGLLSFSDYIFVFFAGGLLFSIPSFLLLWATATYTCKRPGDLPLQRLKLAGWSLLFTVLPPVIILVWQHTNPDNADWSLLTRLIASYFASIAAAIFFYRFPAGPQEARDHPEVDRPEADRPAAVTPPLNSSPD